MLRDPRFRGDDIRGIALFQGSLTYHMRVLFIPVGFDDLFEEFENIVSCEIVSKVVERRTAAGDVV